MSRHRTSDKMQSHAREARHVGTKPEQILWGVLRDRRLAGVKFRRQMPIGQYIVDFACCESRLIVEIDGLSHTDRKSQDVERQNFLEKQGWNVLRVANDDVLTNLEGVLMQIVRALGLDPKRWRDGEYGKLPEGSF